MKASAYAVLETQLEDLRILFSEYREELQQKKRKDGLSDFEEGQLLAYMQIVDSVETRIDNLSDVLNDND